MAYLVTDYLEETVKKYSDKIAFDDCTRSISFGQLRTEAMMVAQKLIDLGLRKKPILVFMEKSVLSFFFNRVLANLGPLYFQGILSPHH